MFKNEEYSSFVLKDIYKKIKFKILLIYNFFLSLFRPRPILLLTLQISCQKLHVRYGDSHKVFEDRVRMKHF